MKLTPLSLFFVYYRHTLLPDMYEFFKHATGDDRVYVAFLRIFAGNAVEFPSDDELMRCVRDMEIYEQVMEARCRDAKVNRPGRRTFAQLVKRAPATSASESATVRRLAKAHHITPAKVRSIANKLDYLREHDRLPYRRGGSRS